MVLGLGAGELLLGTELGLRFSPQDAGEDRSELERGPLAAGTFPGLAVDPPCLGFLAATNSHRFGGGGRAWERVSQDAGRAGHHPHPIPQHADLQG